jgi:hypothetical protein
MITSLNTQVSTVHIADLRAAADRRRSGVGGPLPNTVEAHAPAVVLRLARDEETDVVSRLAALDDAPPVLDGEVLLAVVDDEAVAALSVRDGRVIANPFVRTEEAVALLRLRATHLSVARPRRRFRLSLRPRLA